jgi:hypothetical protein
MIVPLSFLHQQLRSWFGVITNMTRSDSTWQTEDILRIWQQWKDGSLAHVDPTLPTFKVALLNAEFSSTFHICRLIDV